MNIALIFAGGVGIRMNSLSKPKQFLELHGKPIHSGEILTFGRRISSKKL
jgi:2-C-methyl-D-erythritol 4-phosphate cytidylyltransferase